MPTIDEALHAFARRLSSKDKNRSQYINRVHHFLKSSNGEMTREAVETYMATLGRYSPSSRRQFYSLLQSLFTRNGIEWPFHRGEGPQVSDLDINAPAIDPSVVAAMVKAAKAGVLDAEKAAYLAISTTYGCRKVELCELHEESLNLKDRTIYIATAKHGRQRYHLVPDEIMPVLEAHTFRRRTDDDLFRMWYFIEDAVGFGHHPRLGWHAVRRTLDTELLRVLPETTVQSFLRWKKSSSSRMAFRYSATTYIGFDGSSRALAADLQKEDLEVFSKHPFLPYWGKDGYV